MVFDPAAGKDFSSEKTVGCKISLNIKMMEGIASGEPTKNVHFQQT